MSLVGQRKEALDTPTLWVDLDLLEKNIATMAAHFKQANVGWRPHMKGVKIPAIAHKVIAAGALGVTCAKLSEAEVMAQSGINDILIANQIVGPIKIGRLVQLRRQVDVKVAVDSRDNVAELSATAAAAGVEIGVVVDLDTGMKRTGVSSIAEAVALGGLVHDSPGLSFKGLMAWEGHTLRHQDDNVKKAAIVESVTMLTDAAEQCRQMDLPVSIVSGGGSGTYQITPFLPGLTEIQAGGAMFNDVIYSHWGVTTQQALFVKAMVTSRPAPDRIVIDAGFKALPSTPAAPHPIGLDNVASVRSSAEHGTITLEAPNKHVMVGDTLDLVVGYTDATLFLHDCLIGIRNNIIEVEWEIVGRGKLT